MDRYDAHKALLDQMHDVYVRKNKDYGNSATDTFNKFGLLAYVIRFNDKLSRIEALISKSKDQILVKDESICDTLMDLANYCVMAVMDLTEQDVCAPVVTQEPYSPRIITNVIAAKD